MKGRINYLFIILLIIINFTICKEIGIRLKEQIDFSNVQYLNSRNVKSLESLSWIEVGEFVTSELQNLASNTQQPILDIVKKYNVQYHSFFITNFISLVDPPDELLEELSKIKNIEIIKNIEPVSLPKVIEVEQPNVDISNIEDGPQLNVKRVKAPDTWSKGFKGQGIVIGIIDSGVFLHNDLIENYRGYQNNGNYDHNYNWIDYVGSYREPADPNGHGTHCAGTAVGKNAKFQVGAAIESKWIACRGLNAGGVGTARDLMYCLQWMLAPTDLSFSNPDSTKRAHVINNSWGGPNKHNLYDDAIKKLQAVRTVVVFAAGNDGPSCNSICWPGGKEFVFTVGALDEYLNTIASFSSRGPPSGEYYHKPSISAPGHNILSCDNKVKNQYSKKSGTSMAAPLVAGCIAIFLSAGEITDVEQVHKHFENTAYPIHAKDCDLAEKIPNNVYGYGLIVASSSINLSISYLIFLTSILLFLIL